jgi:hypothetical protein
VSLLKEFYALVNNILELTHFTFDPGRTYGTIISRWGGGGKDDLVKRYLPEPKKSVSINASDQAAGTLEPCVTALLNVLCFSTSLLSTSWAIIQSNPKVVSDLYDVIDVNKRLVLITSSVSPFVQ